MEEKAARAYDLAALKYWGSSTHINFPVRSTSLDIKLYKFMFLYQNRVDINIKKNVDLGGEL